MKNPEQALHSRRSVGRLVIGVAAATVLALTAGCGAESSGGADQGASEIGDPAYVFDQIKTVHESGVALFSYPDSLLDSLPNHRVVAKTEAGTVETSFTDLVLTGTVVDVRPGDAVRYTNANPGHRGNEEDGIEAVDFGARSASDRNVIVTIKPNWSSGESIGETLEVRMGTAGGDPYDFMAGLRGLQEKESLWLLKRATQGRYKGEWSTVMGSALVGPVAHDGAVDFPALGDDEADFVKSLTTVSDLRKAAEAPERTTQMDLTR